MCKNEVIPAPESPARLLGFLGTSPLPCHELGVGHLQCSCQQIWAVFRRLGTEIPQGLDRHTVKGPGRITVRNGPTPFHFDNSVPWLDCDRLWGLVGKLSGGEFMSSSSRKINRWGGFSTCRSGKSAKPLLSL